MRSIMKYLSNQNKICLRKYHKKKFTTILTHKNIFSPIIKRVKYLKK